MFNPSDIFHPINFNKSIEAPEKFTYPFQYVPHRWVEQAANELKEYLQKQKDFDYQFGWDNSSVGKMFGVLIVRNSENALGYLAAFSGKINENNRLSGFVPPVFDILNPNGFFKIGESELDFLNQQISDLENSTSYLERKKNLNKLKFELEESLKSLKAQHKIAKKNRNLKRKEIQVLEDENSKQVALNELIQESKNEHFELKDYKRKSSEKLSIESAKFLRLQQEIDYLKNLRKKKSSDLQFQIHNSFSFQNALDETSSLRSIFDKCQKTPPAGAGECAGPRLLQYAFKNNLKPICMGEFWWGKEPNSEIRKHGEFYPACKSKCEPILKYMLQGLEVEENPIVPLIDFSLDINFEDEFLILVNKPAGVLSVPGKDYKECLWQKVKNYLPQDLNPIMVHRLDMSTSGLILIAKNLEIYRALQHQFTQRKVKKTYTAILDGISEHEHGKIDLPLRPDLDNRPMQMLCNEHGKQAVTFFKVIEKKENKTKILFYPITGRTHQLRVHSAHHKGLGLPILGDDLYGNPKDRLYLHASELEFTHPVSGECLKFKNEAPF